ncbi:hypothetical protein RvY_05035-4 [Ramazzottius varieornatus]|uniref:Uncharacterized protein n=1 Tax=Ramazzottius varieornatus TaxID=947166 RepID=A0A1D1V3K6_RAMVA|nr:hypothetical protein RvY_05035-4 [Ramazzottius varieornatus]
MTERWRKNLLKCSRTKSSNFQPLPLTKLPLARAGTGYQRRRPGKQTPAGDESGSQLLRPERSLLCLPRRSKFCLMSRFSRKSVCMVSRFRYVVQVFSMSGLKRRIPVTRLPRLEHFTAYGGWSRTSD